MFAALKQSFPDVQAPAYVNPDNIKFIADHPETTEQFKGLFDDHDGEEKGGRDNEEDDNDDQSENEEQPGRRK